MAIVRNLFSSENTTVIAPLADSATSCFGQRDGLSLSEQKGEVSCFSSSKVSFKFCVTVTAL